MYESDSEQVLRSELLNGESILWSGKPETSVIFSRSDIFLVPFSLMWGGFALFWEFLALGFYKPTNPANRPPIIFPLFGIPFVLIGLYMIFGRFIYKYLKKKSTYYAVTDKRVLSLSTLGQKSVQAMDISRIPSVNKSVGRNGIGILVFGDSAGQYANTGMGFFPNRSYGGPSVVFYDIKDCDDVYRRVSDLIEKKS